MNCLRTDSSWTGGSPTHLMGIKQIVGSGKIVFAPPQLNIVSRFTDMPGEGTGQAYAASRIGISPSDRPMLSIPGRMWDSSPERPLSCFFCHSVYLVWYGQSPLGIVGIVIKRFPDWPAVGHTPFHHQCDGCINQPLLITIPGESGSWTMHSQCQ